MRIPVWIDSAVGKTQPGAYVSSSAWPAGANRWDRAPLPSDRTTSGLVKWAQSLRDGLSTEYGTSPSYGQAQMAPAGSQPWHAVGAPRLEINYEVLSSDQDMGTFETNAVELLRILSVMRQWLPGVLLSVDGVPAGWHGRSENVNLPTLLATANGELAALGITSMLCAGTPMLYWHHQQPTPTAFFDLTAPLCIAGANALNIPTVPYLSLHFEDAPGGEENLPDDAITHQAEWCAKAYARGQIDGVKLFLGWDDTKGAVPQTPADQHALTLTGQVLGYSW